MKTLIYSTSNPHNTKREDIYLGNLKKVFSKGKERLIGNVLLETFLNIPNEFISISRRTGKKVVRIFIDENKDGTDMFGFTHNIRIDTFVGADERDEEWKDGKASYVNELKSVRLGISESDISIQTDIQILQQWKTALDKSIAEIKIKISEMIKNNSFYYKTERFFNINKEKTQNGILSQQIQIRMGQIKKEKHIQNEIQNQTRFKDIAKEVLPNDLFNKIIEKLKECEKKNNGIIE